MNRAGARSVGPASPPPRPGDRAARMEDNLPRHTRTVTLGELVERVVTGAHSELHALAHNLPGQPEAERKRELARFLHNLRQRLVRLAVVAEWAPVQKVRPTSDRF